VKHAIRTQRVVNPLNPVYDSLDGDRLRPPMTPNILNGDPVKFGLAQPDYYKDQQLQFVPPSSRITNVEVISDSNDGGGDIGDDGERFFELSAREPAVSARQSARQQSGRSEFVLAPTPASKLQSKVPPMNINAMNQTKDERIANLEQELQRLKAVSAQSYRGEGGGAGIASGRSMSASQFVASARGGGGSNPLTATNRMATTRISSRVTPARSDVAPVMVSSRPTPSFNQTTAVKSKSNSNTARSTANATARRENAQLAAEIASVRDL
jgi:hypothetical protein